MKRFIVNTIYFMVVLFAVLVLVLTGCTEEQFTPAENQSSVSVVLAIPGAGIPSARLAARLASLRSMDGLPENEVTEVDLLVFQGTGNPQFTYRKRLTQITNANDNGKYTATFKTELNPGDNYNILIIANASGIINNLITNGQINTGDTKTSVLEKLEYSETNKWPVSGEYRPIPMVGETGPIMIKGGITISGIEMVRMLSRIDVKINTADFTLQNIYLYNYNTKGRISPVWDSNGNLLPGVSTSPNLPLSPGQTNTALIYAVNGAGSYYGEIFTFESAKTNDDPEYLRYTSTCLVLEGTYQGNTYFYRVDFTFDDGNYMSLLRNHRYEVNVDGIYGIGYTSVTDALKSYTVMSNLKTRTISYNLGDIKNIVYNGQYMLGVNYNEFILPNSAQNERTNQNNFVIYADYIGGWVVEKITDQNDNPNPSWITLSTTFGNGSTKYMTWFNLSENTGNSKRVAYIYLKSGRLSQKVRVTQLSWNTPNCYFLSPNATIDIPVIKPYYVWKDIFAQPLNETDAVIPELLWQDTPGLITSVNLADGDHGKASFIRIKAANLSGNAVIQVKIGGIVRWSWHVWVTDYDPDSSSPGAANGAYDVTGGKVYRYNNTISNNVFMDRNLGATSALPGDVNARGLLYQWGRKDPFPGSKVNAKWLTGEDSTEPPLYNISGGAVTLIKETRYMTDNIPYAVQNPLRYLCNAGSGWTSNVVVVQHNNLWDNTGTQKSIYDPSPEGWRIPKGGNYASKLSPWYKSGVVDGIISATINYGAAAWDIDNQNNVGWNLLSPTYTLGYYPAGGHRNETTGTLTGVTQNCSVWTATSLDTYSRHYLHLNRTGWGSAEYGSSAWGNAVRCVKEP